MADGVCPCLHVVPCVHIPVCVDRRRDVRPADKRIDVLFRRRHGRIFDPVDGRLVRHAALGDVLHVRIPGAVQDRLAIQVVKVHRVLRRHGSVGDGQRWPCLVVHIQLSAADGVHEDLAGQVGVRQGSQAVDVQTADAVQPVQQRGVGQIPVDADQTRLHQTRGMLHDRLGVDVGILDPQRLHVRVVRKGECLQLREADHLQRARVIDRCRLQRAAGREGHCSEGRSGRVHVDQSGASGQIQRAGDRRQVLRVQALEHPVCADGQRSERCIAVAFLRGPDLDRPQPVRAHEGGLRRIQLRQASDLLHHAGGVDIDDRVGHGHVGEVHDHRLPLGGKHVIDQVADRHVDVHFVVHLQRQLALGRHALRPGRDFLTSEIETVRACGGSGVLGRHVLFLEAFIVQPLVDLLALGQKLQPA